MKNRTEIVLKVEGRRTPEAHIRCDYPHQIMIETWLPSLEMIIETWSPETAILCNLLVAEELVHMKLISRFIVSNFI